ncbi:hypothetical protein CFB3_42310 [Clostridium folliculivorans]|uniref:Uncharacterized protein n=1 Tax=Clostridium folliculivorans TaxID=2886038 RepID=A0A9W5Y4I6_9CLOT|nr:hypothetical protein CFOLD11_31490 [Clostridium folliculivorans]GKU32123.1 hypothetical protein CFB3_42310 [Clostridium folliculivorans]
MKPSNQYVSFAYMVLNPAAMLKDKERVIKISFSEEIFLFFRGYNFFYLYDKLFLRREDF